MDKIFANEFHKDTIPSDGNKYLLGNGYLGCRGTLDEYTKKELVGLNLPGLYDEVSGKWCESVNSPNPFTPMSRPVANG
jgi:trehalose/maltose hydrolase-like predicted phosphorylase